VTLRFKTPDMGTMVSKTLPIILFLTVLLLSVSVDAQQPIAHGDCLDRAVWHLERSYRGDSQEWNVHVATTYISLHNEGVDCTKIYHEGLQSDIRNNSGIPGWVTFIVGLSMGTTVTIWMCSQYVHNLKKKHEWWKEDK
jgi:hypothetical protein